MGKFSENFPTGGGSAALLPVGKSNNTHFWEIQQPFGESTQQQAGRGHMITEKLTSDGLKWKTGFHQKSENMMEKHNQIKVFDENLIERGSV